YVADRNNLGGYDPYANHDVQEVTGLGDSRCTPAYLNGHLYFRSPGQPLKEFTVTNGVFSATPVASSTTRYPYPGATPSVSADGTRNGIVWEIEDFEGTDNDHVVLHAYDASDVSKELYNSEQSPDGADKIGPGVKFPVPTIVNGHVYVATAGALWV